MTLWPGSSSLSKSEAHALHAFRASGDADIDMPGRSLTAHANFTNHAIVNPSDETNLPRTSAACGFR